MSRSNPKSKSNHSKHSYDVYKIQLQIAMHPKIIHDALCDYLKRTIGLRGNLVSIKELQYALNAKASAQQELGKFKFGPDQRIYELLADEAIWAVINKNKIEDVNAYFSWESTYQPEIVQKITNSKTCSIDGVINLFDKKQKKALSIPVELKSTMRNPNDQNCGDIRAQVREIIHSKKEDLAMPAQISAIFVMPYSPRPANTPEGITTNPRLDLAVLRELQAVISKDSLAALVLFSICPADGVCVTACLIGRNDDICVEGIGKHLGSVKFLFPNGEDDTI